MTVTASLNDYSARWSFSKIISLYRSRTPKVSERGLKHPPMTNGNQILEPAFVRSFDQRNDIALVALAENDFAVRQSRALLPQRLASLITLIFCQKCYFCHVILALKLSVLLIGDFQTGHREILGRLKKFMGRCQSISASLSFHPPQVS